MYVFVQGDIEATHRGFFCDDESLKHPYMKDKVNASLLLSTNSVRISQGFNISIFALKHQKDTF